MARFFDQSVVKWSRALARPAALLESKELGTGMSITTGWLAWHIQGDICPRVSGAGAAQLNLSELPNQISQVISARDYSAAVSRMTGGSFSLAFQTTSSGVPMTRG